MSQTPAHEDKLLRSFLRHYAKKGAVGPSLVAAGATRDDLRRWQEGVEGFEGMLRDSHEDAVDEAVAELRLRAVHGRDSILFHGGTPIWRRDPRTGDVLLDDNFEPIAYTENERSDSLLALYVKAHRAEYREKGSVELSGPGGSSIPVAIMTEFVLPDGKSMEDYEQPAAESHEGPDGGQA